MIRNSKFGGLIPRTHARILPNGSAEIAVDVNLEHGSIKPWPKPNLKCDVGQEVVTVHFDKNCSCVTWPIPVDVVDYIAGGCEFKIWNERDRLRIESPANFCQGLECFLGVPCPTEPLLIDDDGLYVYTWVNKFGQESAPSQLSSGGILQTICGAGFVMYKRRPGDHKITGSTGEESDGVAITYEGGWVPLPLVDFKDSTNSGWTHLSDIYAGLNDPEAVITDYNFNPPSELTSVLSECSLVTWYGNPNSMCDDQIWQWGGSGNLHQNTLVAAFFVNNLRQAAPEKVLGACIQTVGGLDYYYVLTSDYDNSDPDPQLGGVDDKVYRKLVSDPSHPVNGWTLMMTIPYTTYATLSDLTADPIPQGTAYVDANGVAWYTKLFGHAVQPYEYALMKVDMVNLTHEIFDSNRLTTGSWAVTESATGSANWNNFGPDGDAHDLDHHESRIGTASGEVYMYTMGGQEARYDLYARVAHAENFTYELNPDNTGEEIDPGVWITRAFPTKVWSQDTTIELVIKRNGVELRSVNVYEYSDSFSSSSDVDFIEDPDPFEWQPTFAYVTNNTGPLVYTQRWYIFMHPLTPEEDIYLEKIISRQQHVANPTTDSITLSLYRNSTTPELLHQFSSTLNGAASNWYDGVPAFTIPVWRFADSHNFASSGSLNSIADNGWGTYNYRPQFAIDFNGILTTGSGGYTGGPHPSGENILFSGGIGFLSDQIGHPFVFETVKSYQHAMVRGNELYAPEFTAVHEPIVAGGDRSYIFILQDIFPNAGWNNTNELRLTNMINTGMTPPQDIIESAVSHNEVTGAAPGFEYAMLYTISHSGENWANGQAYVIDQTVHLGAYIYNCILGHVSNTANDQPETGLNWTTFWERKPLDIHVRSNVITEAQIKALTGMTDDNFIPEIGKVHSEVLGTPAVPNNVINGPNNVVNGANNVVNS